MFHFAKELLTFATDPEVSTLTTLTNVQNSLFVPDLGRWLNRRPTFTLSRAPSKRAELEAPAPTQLETIQSQPETVQELAEEELEDEVKEAEEQGKPLGQQASMQRSWSWQRKPPELERTHSITSVVSDSHYAVLPHGVSLEGWTEEDKEALDDHVRHMLHSKRSKFKQRMHAFKKYISHREYHAMNYRSLLIIVSTGFPCDPLRRPHHPVWSCLGSLLDR